MHPSPNIRSFWTTFLSASGRHPDTPLFEVFHFDDHEQSANELAQLVLQGKKSATASLLWEYRVDDKRPPREGDLSVVTDWDGVPLCVIESSQVEVRAFDDVEEDFAAAEGEGDLSLRYWRDVHWRYFERVCDALGRQRSSQMPVVCEKFRVVFHAPGPSSSVMPHADAATNTPRWKKPHHL